MAVITALLTAVEAGALTTQHNTSTSEPGALMVDVNTVYFIMFTAVIAAVIGAIFLKRSIDKREEELRKK